MAAERLGSWNIPHPFFPLNESGLASHLPSEAERLGPRGRGRHAADHPLDRPTSRLETHGDPNTATTFRERK